MKIIKAHVERFKKSKGDTMKNKTLSPVPTPSTTPWKIITILRVPSVLLPECLITKLSP